MSGQTQTAERRSVWIFIGILIALLGIGASVYSINHHIEVHALGHTDAACNINATFSCDEVALSKYSEIAGVPLGVFGLGYFVAALVLLGIALPNGKTANEHLHGYALLVVAGVLTSVVLAGISIGSLGTYCLTCIAVYILTLAQLVLLLLGRKELVPAGFNLKSAGNGATTAAIAVAVVVAGFNFLKPTHTPTAESTQADAPKEQQPQLAPKVEDIPINKSAYSGLGEDYRKGSDNASVVIVEFADFECPACGHMAGTIETLAKEYGDRVLVVFKNYPLDNSCNSAIKNKMHEWACKAAVMARCAGEYGKFWPYYEMAFANQKDLNEATMKDWGKKVGLTQDQINACWDNKDIMAKIQDDIAVGNKVGIDSTPTLYINGHKVLGGRSIADLRAAIDQQLGPM